MNQLSDNDDNDHRVLLFFHLWLRPLATSSLAVTSLNPNIHPLTLPVLYQYLVNITLFFFFTSLLVVRKRLHTITTAVFDA
jgi:hypothetical protein